MGVDKNNTFKASHRFPVFLSSSVVWHYATWCEYTSCTEGPERCSIRRIRHDLNQSVPDCDLSLVDPKQLNINSQPVSDK